MSLAFKGKLYVRYLGVPLITSKLRYTYCIPLLEKLPKELNRGPTGLCPVQV